MHYKSHIFGEESNNSFAVKIESLVREIVIQNEIPYYRIESGIEHKTDAGAEENLPVIRIITYFEDTVNKISHILHEEFDVDIEKSTDKKRIRIETFAYKNINYTARLTQTRQNQTEYKRSGDKKFEIQICSMLQDAWTGIEKELGYDSSSIPDEAKRDFYRVGALLEMADIEFLKIRTELSQKLPKSTVQADPGSIKEEAPKQVVDTNANSFIEHLQAVAREVQKEPVPVAPHHHTPQAAAEELSKVVHPQQEVKQPQPVAQPPVASAPSPVVQQQAPPVQQPVASKPQVAPPPVMQQPVQAPPPAQPAYTAPAAAARGHVTAAQHVQSLAPRAVSTPQPSGIAPKAATAPRQEPIHTRLDSDVSVNNLKELANSINGTEKNNNAAPKVDIPAPKEVVTPREPIAVVPPVVSEPFKQMQEMAAPVVEKVEKVVPPAPQPASAQAENTVSSSGFIQKAAELSKDIPVEKTVPFYAEKAKAVQFDENAQMTDITLREFVMNSKLVKEIDQKIAERAGAKINSEIDIEGDVERLRFLKVYSLKQLHDRLSDNKDDIVAFAEKWIGKDNGGSFDSGICLFYLEYLLVGKKNDPAFAVDYVVKFISDNDYSARYIIPTYNSIHNTETASNFSHLTLRA